MKIPRSDWLSTTRVRQLATANKWIEKCNPKRQKERSLGTDGVGAYSVTKVLAAYAVDIKHFGGL